ncbi:hypothetical protein TDB9533_00582 [Thalassocella blandensis]|nr:hypothetical protein TDB9533_00582 [Thalassocella blandensis]
MSGQTLQVSVNQYCLCNLMRMQGNNALNKASDVIPPESRASRYAHYRHHILASLASIGILTAALLVLWLGYSLQHSPDNTLEVREIELALPPPPPPPAVVNTNVSQNVLTLQVQGEGPALKKITIAKPTLSLVKPQAPDVTFEQKQWQALEVDWNAFELKDLDGLPSLLTALRAVFPKSLSRRGITSAQVKLDVIIDEKGKVHLLQIVKNDYPELKTEIDKIVRSSRFTPPKKGDEKVRARFIWPIEFTHER